ncbi:DUF2867 domain-containing protein [Lampropedia puyangensis]|uniref:DUF2867 domain-containing protein n=1 Tax=Lampropedia puyangensis TaxID=1330072 RepID=A0A4S8FC00_9BURK|nr:DUF2867 domain-containing protein [Lampropedia puyangensis]THU05163.1 DUF2867 domain-containing protein [Lampropedia puyangensis]
MKNDSSAAQVSETSVPTRSRIAAQLSDANFYDAWQTSIPDENLCALGHFIAIARQTPRWVDLCMRARNRAGQLVGLKDLGTLSAVPNDKSASAYQAGDRIGIFTVIDNTFDEALIGDEDKHLNVVLSIHRQQLPNSRLVAITVTTVVHVKNWLGHLYMLPVKPMHRLITPAMLANMGRGRHET